MYSYVARQPIIDLNQNLIAYELLFRDGESNQFPNICPDQATSNILTNNHLTLGIEKVTSGHTAFINFHADTLIKNFPSFLDPKNVVIEILEDVPITDELIDACKELKAKGFKFALDDHDFDPKWDIFFPLIDIIKVDVLDASIIDISRYIRRLQDYNITLLAEKVETKEQFEKYKLLGFTLFQGYFFAKPEMIKQKKANTAKQNILELIQHASAKEMDFSKISDTFSKDPGLTYKLLRFINSPVYGRNQEITSLKHALAYIGELELKKFISLLALSDLSSGKCMELMRFSLVRAKFCEIISEKLHDDNNPPKAFLTGILSLIDGILDQQINTVFDIIPIHNDIKEALMNKNNYLRHYLTLAKLTEQGDWKKSSLLTIKLGLANKDTYNAHMQAIEWADDILKQA
ncbi:EAL and HDOD domain-containing protein [Thalassotalea agariperforans]